MAICFARQTVVHAEGGSSAVGLAAYVLRAAMTDEAVGRAYDFRKHGGDGHDLVHAEVFLPEGAPSAYADATALWNSASAAELTVDRKTGDVRFKTGAQVAWHMILAVPKELAAAESAALVRRFIETRFGAAGVAVQWALHDDPVNPHAHLLISTRRLSAEGWGKKAREIAPAMRSKRGLAFVAGDERGELVAAWESFQNAWFRDRGIDLKVDPKLAVRDTHVGVARTADSERAALSAEAQAEAAERMREPAELLAAAGRMRSVWTQTELGRVARRNGLPEEEIADAVAAALAHEESVALLDAGTGRETGYWTTEGIRAQERAVLARAKLMASEPFRPVRAGDAAVIAERLTLTAEQRTVLMRETEGLTRIGAIQGRAGTGKTRTLGAIREAHERRGHRVVGLGPTNVVARSLAADGFATAMTAHLALIHLRNGRDRWNARTVVIVDEAAMLDTDILDRVMLAADRAGARLLLVGDDRQLQSVQRGGLFAPVAALAGSMELRRVQRQKTAWQREASEAFAAGDIAAAVGAYADHDCLAWTETLDESRAALVAAWAEASARDPGASRFIYASTNAEVKRLNAEARAIRVERGEIGAGTAFRTVRGAVHAAAGDRIQFHDTDRHAGIFNGVLGTIVSCSEEEIEVRTDGGAPVSFDPERFEGWGPGYAGTVYRGQGKTQTEVFALYDHAFAWSPSTSYVALTRQTDRVTLHVPEELAADRAALIRQMGRARRLATSLDFAVRDELAPILRETPGLAWERIKADYLSLHDAAGQELALLPDQEGFEALRSLVATVVTGRHYPEQQMEKIQALRETLDRLARLKHPDIVEARNRIEAVSKRLDGLREWMRQSPGRIIELAPGYTAWLRDRDAAIDKWEAAEADPDLREQCALLAEAVMKAEIDRLKDPVRVEALRETLDRLVRHPDIVEARNRIEAVSKRLDGLREWMRISGRIIELAPGYTAWLRDRDAAIDKWEAAEARPDLRQQCELLADAEMKDKIDRLKDPASLSPPTALVEASPAAGPGRDREIDAMSDRISASETKAATARSLAEDLGSTSSRARDFLQWSKTGGRPIHEAPGFAEWRDKADRVLERCDALSGDPELKAHCDRAGASEEAVRAVTAMLRDKRYQRPVVRQQVRQESEESSISFRM